MKTLRLTDEPGPVPAGERSLQEILAAGEGDAGVAGWLEGLQRVGVVDGRSLPELLSSMELPLWAWTRLLVRKGPLADRLRTIEALWSELWAARPDEVETRGLGRGDEALVERLCTALGILYEGAQHRYRRAKPSLWRALGWPSGKRRSRRQQVPARASAPTILCIVSGADDSASWAGEMLRALWPALDLRGADVRIAVVGPATPSLDRPAGSKTALEVRLESYRVETREPAPGETAPDSVAAAAALATLWERIRDLPSLGDVLTHRGVRFADLAQDDIEALFSDWLRDAIGVWGRTTTLLSDLMPAAACVFCDGNGYDRAAADACRARGLPVILAERPPGCVGIDEATCFPVSGPHDAPQLARAMVDLAGMSVRGSV